MKVTKPGHCTRNFEIRFITFLNKLSEKKMKAEKNESKRKIIHSKIYMCIIKNLNNLLNLLASGKSFSQICREHLDTCIFFFKLRTEQKKKQKKKLKQTRSKRKQQFSGKAHTKRMNAKKTPIQIKKKKRTSKEIHENLNYLYNFLASGKSFCQI